MEPESRDPVRHGGALRDMAKLANAPASKGPPRRATADSSGLVDLSALMAQQPNWLDDALTRAKASAAGGSLPPPSFAPGSLAPPSLAVGGSIAPTMRALDDDGPLGLPRSRSLPLIVASTVAGLLVATACVFAVRMSHHAPAVAPPVGAVQAVRAVQATALAHDDDAPVIPPPPAIAQTAPDDPSAAQQAATDPVAARAADTESAPAGRRGRHGRHERALASGPAAAAAAPAEAAPPPAAPPTRQAGSPSGPRTGSALDNALRSAAGPVAAAPAAAPAPAAPKAAPAPAADNRPERPSGSAVTSALTEALPAARRCVAQMSDPSRALVSFGSDGAVHKVDVSGPAGSDPKAASCLRSAFGRAHVPPFSASSYAAGVTVRPQ